MTRRIELAGPRRPPRRRSAGMTRRDFLLQTLMAVGGTVLAGCGRSQLPGADAAAGAARPIPCGPLAGIGELGEPDRLGIRLPPGFSVREIAVTGQPVARTRHVWHNAPDGAATFATPDGGWIYVCNQEDIPGGVGAIRFDADGRIVDAYRILENTRSNCAGGPTPWDTWLSCEEIFDGLVYETDPQGRFPAVALPALGAFNHEAVAVDPVNKALYLTEDDGFGRLYRFRPSARDWPRGSPRPLLEDGVLEALEIQGVNNLFPGNVSSPTPIRWVPVPMPRQIPLSPQVPAATRFDGGEGIWYQDGLVFFATKGTDQVWMLDIGDPARETILTVYDVATHPNPILSGVDNVTISCFGDVLVAEDGGDMQIVVLTPDGETRPLVQFTGQESSEVTGPCFSPDGSRLYCNSQWGYGDNIGRSYEISGFERLAQSRTR